MTLQFHTVTWLCNIAMSHGRPPTCASFSNDERHMTAFRPISEAARSWSCDSVEWWTCLRSTVQHCNVARSRDHSLLQVNLTDSINLWCVATVRVIKKATLSKLQIVKDRSHANKCLRKVKVNPGTDVVICISTYWNADVVCYSATWRTKLNDVCPVVDGKLKMN